MPNGFGRGLGFRGGMGFGFRGSSPPWPYVGLGRGGLPRCGYFLSGAAGAPVGWPYQLAPYAAGPGFSAVPYQQAPYPPSPEFGVGQTPYSFPAGVPPSPGAAPYAPQMTREQELDFLKTQAQAMREQLKHIDAQIQQLGSET